MDIMMLLFLPTVDASVTVIVVGAVVGSVHWVCLVVWSREADSFITALGLFSHK